MNEDLTTKLEQLRAMLFLGRTLSDREQPWQQEAYIDYYEGRIERNPSTEWKAFTEIAGPLLSIFRKKREEIARMERLIQGVPEPTAISATEEEKVIEELYDGIVNLDTEEEWQAFKRNFFR